MQGDAEPDRRDEGQAADELRVTHGEVHRDAAAERVAEEKRGRDLKARDDARHVIGELHDVRVRCLEGGPQGESGEVDDVDGPAQPAEGPDLWREAPPVGGDSRKNHGMRSCPAAPGRDAEAVSVTRGYLHPHASRIATAVPWNAPPFGGPGTD